MMMMMMFSLNAIDQGDKRALLNDSWDRLDLWRSAISANQNVLFGVGTGDYKDVLNEFYRANEMENFASNSLNSHNQFIQIYFSNGLFGLVSVLILLGRPLYISFTENNPLGVLIFFPFLIYGITEVFLGRYQGVVFFVFLHQMFIGYLNALKSETLRNN
jgi:O-antigen ligase